MNESRKLDDLLEKVVEEYTRLQQDFRRKMPKPAGGTQRPTRGNGLLQTLNADLGLIGIALRTLVRDHKAIGMSSGMAVELIDSVQSFGKEVNVLIRRLESQRGHPRSRLRDLQGLGKRTGKLNAAVLQLTHQAREAERQQKEKSSAYEEARTLRSAIAEFDEKLADRLDLEELLWWAASIGPVNFYDPEQVRRLAKVCQLSRLPSQTWEVRYRSDKPGNPLVLLAVSDDFPTREQLARSDKEFGHHDEYIIAARLPRWRVAWKSSWIYQ